MGIGWADRLWVTSAGTLSRAGAWLNAGMILTCMLGLLYPWVELGHSLSIDCLFQTITSLPCPACGYVRGMHCLQHGDLGRAMQYNPGLFFYIGLQLLLIGIGMRSLHLRRQVLLGPWASGAIMVAIAGIWTFKLLYDPAFY